LILNHIHDILRVLGLFTGFIALYGCLPRRGIGSFLSKTQHPPPFTLSSSQACQFSTFIPKFNLGFGVNFCIDLLEKSCFIESLFAIYFRLTMGSLSLSL
jgi:hypothetical protein